MTAINALKSYGDKKECKEGIFGGAQVRGCEGTCLSLSISATAKKKKRGKEKRERGEARKQKLAECIHSHSNSVPFSRSLNHTRESIVQGMGGGKKMRVRRRQKTGEDNGGETDHRWTNQLVNRGGLICIRRSQKRQGRDPKIRQGGAARKKKGGEAGGKGG